MLSFKYSCSDCGNMPSHAMIARSCNALENAALANVVHQPFAFIDVHLRVVHLFDTIGLRSCIMFCLKSAETAAKNIVDVSHHLLYVAICISPVVNGWVPRNRDAMIPKLPQLMV